MTGDSGQNFMFIFILVAAANLLFWVLSLFFFLIIEVFYLIHEVIDNGFQVCVRNEDP